MQVNLLTGPPKEGGNDRQWLKSFFALEGQKIISGGTTTALAEGVLGVPSVVELKSMGSYPPWGVIEGADLVTEGVLTLEGVLGRLCQNAPQEEEGDVPSAVQKMGDLLEGATEVTIFAGGGPRRKTLCKKIAALLESKGKKVIVNHY